VIAYLWSHWLIAIGLVAHINVGYLRKQRGYGLAAAVLRHVLTLGAIAVVVLFFMIAYAQYGLFDTGNFEYKELLAGIPDAERSLIGFVMGLFLAEQLVHYYCDRCLFRMRDSGIRKTVGALL
jgi:p-aminobenzoyl-glutamate transporter AbgT